jgi:hypothetical protein
MFAGLPGIGVGTLFYVLMAVWMPFRELPRLVAGKSSLAQWQLIARQLFYATGIVATVMFAERMLLWILGQSKVAPFSPAAFLHEELGVRAGDSLLAAPITASLLLLAGVLLFVEVLRVIVKHTARDDRQRQPLDDVLDSSTPG